MPVVTRAFGFALVKNDGSLFRVSFDRTLSARAAESRRPGGLMAVLEEPRAQWRCVRPYGPYGVL